MIYRDYRKRDYIPYFDWDYQYLLYLFSVTEEKDKKLFLINTFNELKKLLINNTKAPNPSEIYQIKTFTSFFEIIIKESKNKDIISNIFWQNIGNKELKDTFWSMLVNLRKRENYSYNNIILIRECVYDFLKLIYRVLSFVTNRTISDTDLQELLDLAEVIRNISNEITSISMKVSVNKHSDPIKQITVEIQNLIKNIEDKSYPVSNRDISYIGSNKSINLEYKIFSPIKTFFNFLKCKFRRSPKEIRTIIIYSPSHSISEDTISLEILYPGIFWETYGSVPLFRNLYHNLNFLFSKMVSNVTGIHSMGGIIYNTDLANFISYYNQTYRFNKTYRKGDVYLSFKKIHNPEEVKILFDKFPNVPFVTSNQCCLIKLSYSSNVILIIPEDVVSLFFKIFQNFTKTVGKNKKIITNNEKI